MSNNFKAFENGIRISNGFSADPVTGRVGDIYYNTTTNNLRLCVNSSPVWQDIGGGTRSTDYDWITTDGTTKTIIHNWGTVKIQVQVLNASDNYSNIEVDSITRPDINTLILSASSAPLSSWLVLLQEIV